MMFFYITCNFRMLLAQETTKKVRKNKQIGYRGVSKNIKILALSDRELMLDT